MPIPLDSYRESFPSVKFVNVGDEFRFQLAHKTVQVQKDFSTGLPKKKEDGSDRKQLRLIGISITGTATVKSGKGDEAKENAVTLGQKVAVYVTAHRWGAFIDAQKKLGKPLETGDVVSIKFTGTAKATRAGAQDKKLWAFAIKKPTTDDELAMCAECDALFREIEAQNAEHEEDDESDDAAAVPIDDYDPFAEE